MELHLNRLTRVAGDSGHICLTGDIGPYAVGVMDNWEGSRPEAEYDIVIRAHGKPHTKKQNDVVNIYCQEISKDTGNDFDDIKNHVKQIAVSMGYPFQTLVTGDIEPMSQRDASTKQASLLYDACHLLASREGIVLRG